MKSDYKIAAVVTFLLICLSVIISTVNYRESLKLAHDQLRYQSLSVSLNNIYSEIEKNLIEPYLISSMMASDTFVEEWLKNDENSTEKIKNYLDSIKKRHGVSYTFLVSERTKNYYTDKGFLEKLNRNRKDNQWYYRFIKSSDEHELNLDYNSNLGNSMIVFINYKIIDDGKLLGVTGVGLRMSRIDRMIEKSKNVYQLDIRIFGRDGRDILGKKQKDIFDNIHLRERRQEILSGKSSTFEYEENGSIHIINIKHIPRMDIFVLADAKVKNFTQNILRTFYFNLIVSFLVILFIVIVIVSFIKKYRKKLESLAENDELTGIMNRRGMSKQLKYFMKLFKRNKIPMCILFMDLDNFKSINDIYGHQRGDDVLKRVAEFFRSKVRESDLVSRWGGEEFVVVFIETKLEEAVGIAEKLRYELEHDPILIDMLDRPVTGSFGLTEISPEDELEDMINRADEGMYRAKQDGKNRVVTI